MCVCVWMRVKASCEQIFLYVLLSFIVPINSFAIEPGYFYPFFGLLILFYSDGHERHLQWMDLRLQYARDKHNTYTDGQKERKFRSLVLPLINKAKLKSLSRKNHFPVTKLSLVCVCVCPTFSTLAHCLITFRSLVFKDEHESQIQKCLP